MKGCLKHAPSPSHTPSEPSCSRAQAAHHKCVTFCARTCDQVFVADEWDRSPVDVSSRLSYQDILELKEIQLSLPRAAQLPDLEKPTNRPATPQYLSRVPLGLLPLLPHSPSSSNPQPPSLPSSSSPQLLINSPSPSPPPLAQIAMATAHAPSPPKTPPASSTESSLAPSRTSSPSPRPPIARKFHFLPLLDTPTDTPTESPSCSVPPSPLLPSHSSSTPPSHSIPHPSSVFLSSPMPTPPSSNAPSSSSSPSLSPAMESDYDESTPSSFSYFTLPFKADANSTTAQGVSPPPHLTLKALPSPVLPPPSPFSLYPPSPPVEDTLVKFSLRRHAAGLSRDRDAFGRGAEATRQQQSLMFRRNISRLSLGPTSPLCAAADTSESEAESSVVHTDDALSCDEGRDFDDDDDVNININVDVDVDVDVDDVGSMFREARIAWRGSEAGFSRVGGARSSRAPSSMSK